MSRSKSPTTAPDAQSDRFVLGRQGIDKLNAIEGIRLSESSRKMFAEFDRDEASAEQRRHTIEAKHRKLG
jgi:hypothetical protein